MMLIKNKTFGITNIILFFPKEAVNKGIASELQHFHNGMLTQYPFLGGGKNIFY